jgi:hypothetical protein
VLGASIDATPALAGGIWLYEVASPDPFQASVGSIAE